MSEQLPQPSDFFSDAPPSRLMGTETEYGAPHIRNSYVRLDELVYETGLLPFEPDPYAGNLAVWLINGAKLYFDCKLVEFASAESAGPFAAAAGDHAGIEVMERLHRVTPSSDYSSSRWPSRRSGTFDIKTSEIRTQGSHENLILPHMRSEKKHFELIANILATYAITRPIWYGAGFVVGDEYSLSQKAHGIGPTINVFETRRQTSETFKPIVKIMDGKIREKAPPEWVIAEIRHADPHMLPYATFMGLGTASLMLRLVEHGYITHGNIDDFRLKDPKLAIHISSLLHKNVLHQPLEMVSGRYKSALDIQSQLADLAADLNSRITLPYDEQIVVDEWVHLCDLLKHIDVDSGDFTSLIGRVEWATKYHLLQRAMGNKATHETIDNIAFDYQWTQLGPKSLGKQVAAKLGTWNGWFTDEINYRAEHPPATRAMARVSLLSEGYLVSQWSNQATTKDRKGVLTATNPYSSQPVYKSI